MKNHRKSPLDSHHIDPQVCSIDLRLEILSKAPFFAGLSHEQLKEINSFFRENGFQKGDRIYYEGDAASRLYAIATGRVKLTRHTPAGKNILLDILVPGEFFGSLIPEQNDEYPETAQALTDACILSIGAEAFQRIMLLHPSISVKVLLALKDRLKNAHETVRQLSAYAVEKRIAHTLLKLGEKLGERQEIGLLIQVPLSRDDLGDMTGTTTETASRVISQFQKKGWVLTGRQWIAITHWEALTSLVDEELY
jgi:CRP/FNR family transcriptional regulator, nitrogen oxide reductase regulator